MDQELKQWHQEQIEFYRQELPHYKRYCDYLTEKLTRACEDLGVSASVSGRAKEPSSFAMKAARKRQRHPDPARDLTDLCGVRVVTDTEEEVQRVCRWVRSHFLIDEANSEDKKTLLGATQFTYLSVHFVVQLPPAATPVDVLQDIGARKAEIQVRTRLQDVWAGIAHDRVYKSPFPVPERWEREMNNVAAILEAADRDFGAILSNLEDYSTTHGAFLDRERIENAIDVFDLVFANETRREERRRLAVRRAGLLGNLGRWDEAAAALEEFATDSPDPAVLKQLGYALCFLDRATPSSAQYRRGQQLLRQAIRYDEHDAEAHAHLAWTLETEDEEEEALEHYQTAYRNKPRNPYYLMCFLEFQIGVKRELGGLRMLTPVLRQAAETCRQHAEAGVEIPWAHFTKAKAHFLLEEPYAALGELARGISVSLDRASGVPADVLANELRSVKRFGRLREKLQGHDWMVRLLALAAMLKSHPAGPWPESAGEASIELAGKLSPPVVEIAGSCATDHQPVVDHYRPMVLEALAGFSGTVISGCTRNGVAGLAGDLAAARQSPALFVLGYHPASWRVGTELDGRYDKHVRTAGSDFSPLEEMQMWTDILASGIAPSLVRVIGIGGGRISAVGFQIALALGAEVGVFAASERAAEALLKDDFWKRTGRLLAMPDDAMSVRMFATAPTLFDAPSLETAALAAHEEYRRERKGQIIDPSMQPWEKLRQDLKEANRDQISNAPAILRYAGFGIREWTADSQLVEFTPEEVNLLAMMEHGRWCVERSRKGWAYGKDKVPERRLTPYLKPWELLEEDVRQWDRDAVVAWPAIFRDIGKEIHRTGKQGLATPRGDAT